MVKYNSNLGLGILTSMIWIDIFYLCLFCIIATGLFETILIHSLFRSGKSVTAPPPSTSLMRGRSRVVLSAPHLSNVLKSSGLGDHNRWHLSQVDAGVHLPVYHGLCIPNRATEARARGRRICGGHQLVHHGWIMVHIPQSGQSDSETPGCSNEDHRIANG